jgi:hypothetical protein
MMETAAREEAERARQAAEKALAKTKRNAADKPAKKD